MPSLTLGDFELRIFSDGTYPLDGGAFFGVIPKVMWSRKVAADERNYVTAGLNSLLFARTIAHRQTERAGRDRHGQQAVRTHDQVLRPARAAARQSCRGWNRARRHRHRHQHASAFRPLRMEHGARQEWQDRADVSAREILRAGRRMAIRAPSERARLDQLHLRQLRPARRAAAR